MAAARAGLSGADASEPGLGDGANGIAGGDAIGGVVGATAVPAAITGAVAVVVEGVGTMVGACW